MEDYLEIHYNVNRWKILEKKREKAIKVMRALTPLNLPIIIHGSIARGDIREDSDIDIVIVEPPRPFSIVEYYLSSLDFIPFKRIIVQAHPNYTPKVYIYLDEKEEIVVSYPLRPFRAREREFYRWGGELSLSEIKKCLRVPGVNKELKLIIPKPWGHIEYSIIGREGEVSRIVGISIDTILERIRVLTRRKEFGRTGLFVEEEVPPNESIEEAILNISRRNKLFRKAISN